MKLFDHTIIRSFLKEVMISVMLACNERLPRFNVDQSYAEYVGLLKIFCLPSRNFIMND